MTQFTFNKPEPQPAPRAGMSPLVIIFGTAVFLTLFGAMMIGATLLILRTADSGQTAQVEPQTSVVPVQTEAQEAITRNDASLLQPGVTALAQPVASAALTPVTEPALAQPVQEEVRTAALANLQPRHIAGRYKVPTCIQYLDTLTRITRVRFDTGVNQPNDFDMIRARQISQALKSCDQVKVIVEGHSDSRGDEQINIRLSKVRAESVIAKLNELGFDTEHMEAVGFGSSKPINTSGTTSGDGENRRVQFTLAPRARP